MKLSPTSGHPYQALAAALVAKIRRGELRPDDKLPPVRSLAKEYDVTSATVQRAVQQLALDGHVKTVPNVGSFVLMPVEDDGTSITARSVNQRVDELLSTLADLERRVQRLENPAS
ncbi:GntR family transcriptional regulator [Pseudonocardia spinosispora]|uniref:GntR family transcriptional regulator n=1 Tax=Pseudonocardia spinosispora TaxID=103441 RepID=UPI0003FC8404|nr:winged helix-turn-helix domain-containing protein [Pseudonocardia spinosispora]